MRCSFVLSFLISFIFIQGCGSDIEITSGEPDHSSPKTIVQTAIQYQIKQSKNWLLPLLNKMCKNYMSFYDELKEYVAGKLKGEFDNLKNKFSKFIDNYSTLLEKYDDIPEEVKIQGTDVKNVDMNENADLNILYGFLYQKLTELKIEIKGYYDNNDEKKTDIRNNNTVNQKLYKEANKLLKTFGAKKNLFGNDKFNSIKDFTCNEKDFEINEIFKIVKAEYELPRLNIKTKTGKVENKKRSENYLVYQQNSKWYLSSFDALGEDKDPSDFENWFMEAIIYREKPNITVKTSTPEETAKTAAELYLACIAKEVPKTIKTLIEFSKESLKLMEMTNKWTSSNKSLHIKDGKKWLDFMTENEEEFAKYELNILEVDKQNELKTNVTIQILYKTLALATNKKEENEEGRYYLKKKNQKILVTVNLIEGKWKIINILEVQ